MSSTPPVPADRQLPRGHLLVLNRSFRRTLETRDRGPPRGRHQSRSCRTRGRAERQHAARRDIRPRWDLGRFGVFPVAQRPAGTTMGLRHYGVPSLTIEGAPWSS